VKQRRRRLPPFALQGFLSLEVCQPSELTRRELQKGFHVVINIGAIRRRGRFFPRQQLRNVGFRHGGGTRQIALLIPQVGQALPNHEGHIHRRALLAINHV
jgi:hypothetical protein